MARLEQLQIHKWKYISKFCDDFISIASQTGRAFDPEIADKFFRKLPGALGLEIKEYFERLNPTIQVGLGPRIQHVFTILTEKCTIMQIQKQLKKETFGFYNFPSIIQ